MAKLAVNISAGTIEIEGDEKFILSAFAEVRSALKEIDPTPSPASSIKASKAMGQDEGVASEGGKSKTAQPKGKAWKPVQPTLNSGLDLNGLSEFVGKYKPSKNTERILVFAAFLRDNLSIAPCSFDDIFSCFHSMKSSMKIPQAFAKNMNDTKTEGYIYYSKLSEISIPIMGENHLVSLSKRAAE